MIVLALFFILILRWAGVESKAEVGSCKVLYLGSWQYLFIAGLWRENTACNNDFFLDLIRTLLVAFAPKKNTYHMNDQVLCFVLV